MARSLILSFLFFFLFSIVEAQENESPIRSGFDTSTRKWVLAGVQTGLWTGSFLTLNKAWYSQYPKKRFHLYNDFGEWQQMDKAGHFWSTNQISRHSYQIWRWTGMEEKKAIWVGSLSGMAYLSIIEILDGYSDKWGFSIPDVLANMSGAAAFGLQQGIWHEQRISFKLSYSPVAYGPLKSRSDELFGKSQLEKVLKDYNGQTYWASFNIHSFIPDSRVPSWLNLAVGYGAGMMLGGYRNEWVDATGLLVSRNDIDRYRRYHLSLDVDLTKIKTKHRALKTVFDLFNVLKIPAPGIEYDTRGRLRFHPIFY